MENTELYRSASGYVTTGTMGILAWTPSGDTFVGFGDTDDAVDYVKSLEVAQ